MKNNMNCIVVGLRSVLALAVCAFLFAFHGQALAARTINWVTLNGASSVQVLPGASIPVSINVTTTGSGGNNDWESTDWRISTTPPGTVSCVNHGDHTSAGTYTESFTIIAPTAEGTYNAYIRVYDDDYCSSGVTAYTGSNAIVVAIPPVVTSIARASVNPVDPNMIVSWNVIFSKSVTGVDASDFALVQGGGTSGASITSVSGSGTSWTVSANTGNGGYNGGTLGLNLIDDDTIVDSGGRKLGGTGSGNGNFTTGEVYTVSPPCAPPANTPSGVILSCVCDNFNRNSLNPSTIFGSNWIASTSDTTQILPIISSPGYLRLTNNTTNNAKAATVPSIFPAAGNYISVEFRLYAYNGNSADGIGVTLSDYTVTPKPGAFGGSLGYAQKTGIAGFAGGWIGVGIDEFGNYQNPTEGRIKGPGVRAESVAVRGSGPYYPWLAGTAANISPQIDSPSSTVPAPGYQYQVIVDARNASASSTSVAVNRNSGSGYANLINVGNVFTAATAQGYSQSSVPANWQISFTGSTGSNVNIHEIGNVRICAQTIIPPSGGTANDFNAIDEAYGTPPSAPAALDFATGRIFMKIAGVPFKLNVAAMNNTQIQTGYVVSGSKDVTVKLVDNSDGVCVIDSTQPNFCNSACTSKTAVASQTLNFTPADAGKKLSGNFTLNSAYKNLVAIISDSALKTCSTDAFSVRPPSFAPVTTSATNTGTSGTPVFKAGTGQFSITAVTNGIAGFPSLYTGVPKVNNTALLPIAPATVAGSIAGTFSAATSGTPSSTSTGSSFTYSEFGAFTLLGHDPTNTSTATWPRGVYEGVHATECGTLNPCTPAEMDTRKTSSWTGVDSVSTKGDCVDESYSNVKNAAGMYGCLFGTTANTSFGRFAPDHFALLDNSTVTPACGVNGFTYMDQPFGKIQFDIEARNGTEQRLQNYTGALATAVVSLVAENNDAGIDLGGRMLLPAAAWTTGTYSVSSTTSSFRRRATLPDGTVDPDGAYDNLQLGVLVVDPDGAALAGPNMNPAATGCGAACNSRRIGDTTLGVAQPTKVRFGRLKLSNAHGSERLNLPIPMRVEYWNGTSFVTNTLDSCTSLVADNVLLSNRLPGITNGNMPAGNFTVGAFANGVGSLRVLKPTSTPVSKGSVDICVDLGNDPAGDPLACAATTSAAKPWLQGQWRGIGYNYDPRTRATFGVFKNANEFIYIREMY